MGTSAVDYLDRRLDNGLRVLLSEDHTAGVVAVNVRYGVGSRDERPPRTGFAHLFEHLMFCGSSKVAAGEHLRTVQRLGGQANAITSMDSTAYHQSVPAGALRQVLWLEAERMGDLLPAVTGEALDLQRKVVESERRETLDNLPHGTSLERLAAALFPPGHPYHHLPIGSVDDLENASLDDVRAFFTRHYPPGNAVLTVVGDFDPAQAMAWIEEYFGPISPGPLPPRPAFPALHPHEQLSLTVHEPAPAAVFIGRRLPAAGGREFEVARLTGVLLGHGQGSRLNQRLVRGQDLAATVKITTIPLTGAASLGVVHLVPRPGTDPAEVAAACRRELIDLAEHGPGEDDLARAVAQVEASWLSRLDTAEGRAGELSWHGLLMDGPARVNDVLPLTYSITPSDVQRTAGQWAAGGGSVVLTYRFGQKGTG
ncbi:pitrilysin family protein [Nonomuraea sp. NPDC005650]|uniref:M16 family metallopeptidase n=1 Tax=Nonomuraea sp. NPDC005650 TaxID=3157045 RepID=UPI0033B0F488